VMFRMGERRALARRANRDQPLGALCNLPGDERAKRLLVDPAIAERCHKSGHRSLKTGGSGHEQKSLKSTRRHTDAALYRPDESRPHR
jgi:hypothetical protein